MIIVIIYTVDVALQELGVHVPQTHHATWTPSTTYFLKATQQPPFVASIRINTKRAPPLTGTLVFHVRRTLRARFVSTHKTFHASPSVLHKIRFLLPVRLPSRRFDRTAPIQSSGD